MITLLLNISDNRELLENFSGGKKQERKMEGYFKEAVVRSGKTSPYFSKNLEGRASS